MSWHVSSAAAPAEPRAIRRSALPEREKNAETWSRQAVELLQRAQRRGYFKDEGRLEKLKEDPDLAALRGRADFERWLAGL